MKKALVFCFGALFLIVICIGAALMAGVGTSNYYTQIDNSKIERIEPHGDMNYSYTLPSYNDDGEERDITFETARELRESAFIELKVRPILGVASWAEVQYGQLPAAVQSHYQN